VTAPFIVAVTRCASRRAASYGAEQSGTACSCSTGAEYALSRFQPIRGLTYTGPNCPLKNGPKQVRFIRSTRIGNWLPFGETLAPSVVKSGSDLAVAMKVILGCARESQTQLEARIPSRDLQAVRYAPT
jgi:hypothetical protein